jgi:hypothetical protein
MVRWFNLVIVGLVVATATWTYQVKHDAEAQLDEIRELKKQIALERETIELLKADWAHLSHPSRLQALVERYQEELGLQVTDSNQIIGVNELPDAPIFAPGDPLGDIIAGEFKDEITTGSIDGGNN